MAAMPETSGLDLAQPRRADGLELLGPLEGSGFKQRAYLARRSDGQVLQLSPLLYLIAEKADGKHDFKALAEELSHEYGRRVREDQVRALVDGKLLPAGVLAAPQGSTMKLERCRPVLGLRFRLAVVPPAIVKALAGFVRPLFFPAVAASFATALVALDAWLLVAGDLSDSIYQVAHEPGALLALAGLLILGTAFHECGHAGACRYGGANPGAIGVGLYLVWPVFYTDLTDTYRLRRRDRLRADLGGIYFSVVFMVVGAACYFLTGYDVLLLLVPLVHYQILFQLLPFIRFDGYYILSDLTGVPNLMSRIRPTLVSLLPGTERHPRVEELRGGIRAGVTGYVLVTVLALSAGLMLLLLNAPRILAAASDGLLLQLDRFARALQGGDAVAGTLGLLHALALALPVAALALTTGLITRRIAKAFRRALPDGRSSLWPEPGRAATAIVWNVLFDLSILLAFASFMLLALASFGLSSL
jgi:putative peptide zinc metalloprotease protein